MDYEKADLDNNHTIDKKTNRPSAKPIKQYQSIIKKNLQISSLIVKIFF